MPKQYSLMIARFPGGNAEHPASSQYVIKLNTELPKDPRISNIVNWYKSDTPITMVRNLCVKTAQDQGIDYLLMIDSDMAPDIPGPGARPFWESSWEFMMDRRKAEGVAERNGLSSFNALKPATIAAPYCGPPPHENCYVFQWATYESDTPEPNFKLAQFSREEAAVRGGIEEVAALPTGLILYDMRVFKELGHPWFEYGYTDEYKTAKDTTEDVYQTRNASMLRLPQFCNWDSWAAHVKLKHVGKPTMIQIDHVHHTLVKAVQRNRPSDEQLVIRRDPLAGDPRLAGMSAHTTDGFIPVGPTIRAAYDKSSGTVLDKGYDPKTRTINGVPEVELAARDARRAERHANTDPSWYEKETHDGNGEI